MSRKKTRKYQTIKNIEAGIAGYLFINAVLEAMEPEHKHLTEAKFVAAASLNQLMAYYADKNGPEALQALADRLTNEAATPLTSDTLEVR
jgi:hypothetical protein